MNSERQALKTMDVNVFDKYDFFTGVPDSQLKPLCDWLLNKYGVSPDRHIIAANEGNAVAIAAGYHLATGKIPVVYLQNSGIGNIINPVASLLNDRVYGIPVLFVVGWRGEPGVSDEPQHVYQGEVTIKLLEDMDIHTHIIGKEMTEAEFHAKSAEFEALFARGKSAAFVVRKSALSYIGEIAFDSGWDGELFRRRLRKFTRPYTGRLHKCDLEGHGLKALIWNGKDNKAIPPGLEFGNIPLSRGIFRDEAVVGRIHERYELSYLDN